MHHTLPLLRRLGDVTVVRDPVGEARERAQEIAARDESPLLLLFMPPHKVPAGISCPHVVILAWEYSTIPSDPWAGEPRNDWRVAIGEAGGAIACSGAALAAIREAMGADFPACALPTPLWDRYSRLAPRKSQSAVKRPWTLRFEGACIDSRSLELEPYKMPQLPPFQRGPCAVTLSGVVYTAVFNPGDVRKHWPALLEGFLWNLREEPEATLLLKLIHHDANAALRMIVDALTMFAPFRCRIVAIHGYLPDEAYDAMIVGTSYAVNSAMGEGLCLPLVEFMSAGTPAIAPDHTAMQDYVTSANAFPVRSTADWSQWPHDPRGVMRCLNRLIEWDSLSEAYAESWRVAHGDPARYAAMSRAAVESLRLHCSERVIEKRLREFLEEHRRYLSARS
jgi:glycosyltransferase involved in cell wall biosynthesis